MGRGRNEKPRRLAGAFLGREGDYTLNLKSRRKAFIDEALPLFLLIL